MYFLYQYYYFHFLKFSVFGMNMYGGLNVSSKFFPFALLTLFIGSLAGLDDHLSEPMPLSSECWDCQQLSCLLSFNIDSRHMNTQPHACIVSIFCGPPAPQLYLNAWRVTLFKEIPTEEVWLARSISHIIITLDFFDSFCSCLISSSGMFQTLHGNGISNTTVSFLPLASQALGIVVASYCFYGSLVCKLWLSAVYMFSSYKSNQWLMVPAALQLYGHNHTFEVGKSHASLRLLSLWQGKLDSDSIWLIQDSSYKS